MEDQYLIPANTKRGMLIFNAFTVPDLILLGAGITITLILVIAVPPHGLLQTILWLAPALISAFLVTPIPNYHNVLSVIKSMIEFYNNRRRFYWGGWIKDE
ncbi:MAG: hypothetical protein PHS45_01900 [Bacilli bacterium]|nr:hypothetical protein [Bacilli bacterium]